MIIGGRKQPVIQNIQRAAANGTFNVKVEVNDPQLDAAQQKALMTDYLQAQQSRWSGFHNGIARTIANGMTWLLNRDTQVVGLKNLTRINGGAIVTCNHFNPLDNTAVRYAIHQAGRHRLFAVIEDTNLAMLGLVGYLMRHYDTIPIFNSPNYMARSFPQALAQQLDQNRLVLIYPEQEMWFNYRKPRPTKRGPYHYAVKFNVPIASLFIEIQNLPHQDNAEFNQTRYIVHVLDPIYPDPNLTARENELAMQQRDEQQKVAAYEAAYHHPYTTQFDVTDIAGWRQPTQLKEAPHGNPAYR